MHGRRSLGMAISFALSTPDSLTDLGAAWNWADPLSRRAPHSPSSRPSPQGTRRTLRGATTSRGIQPFPATDDPRVPEAASRGSVVVVAVARRARLVLPPALHFPCFDLGFDAVGQAGVDGELERLAGPLWAEADFVEHPGATVGLGIAKIRLNPK